MGKILATLTITGHPAVLKNSKQIFVRGGRPIVTMSKAGKAYQLKAILELEKLWGDNWPITQPVNAEIVSYGAWKRTNKNIPDASNLYQMPEDVMELAGVLADDRQIDSHDGSRRVCMCDTCDERPLYKSGPKKGTHKPDCGAVKKCPFERVEIVITEDCQ